MTILFPCKLDRLLKNVLIKCEGKGVTKVWMPIFGEISSCPAFSDPCSWSSVCLHSHMKLWR